MESHIQAEAAGIEALVKTTEVQPRTPPPAPTQVEIETVVETSENIETPITTTETTTTTTPSSLKRKRTELTLGDKVKLIEESCVSGKSHRYLAGVFNIGKTTVHDILKKKDRILSAYKNGLDGRSRKRIRVRLGNDDINRLTWHWYEHKKAQCLPVQGPVVQAKAREFAEEFEAKEFKASNGWLERFKKRYNLHFGSHECFTMKDDKPWKENVMSVTDGYRPEDIFTLQEVGLLFRAPPDKTFFSCVGCSLDEIKASASERLTVLLCCNMTGEFHNPVVVGKMSPNPSLRQASVTWRSNRRSWMTSMIFEKWLREFDSKLKSEDRHVVIFLDLTTSHPPHSQLSNIKLVFFPQGKSQEIHPHNLGITDAIRYSYRKKLLLHVINNLQDHKGPQEGQTQKIFQEIQEEQACKWLAEAIDEIPACTLAKSFESAGFHNVSTSDSLSSYSMAFTALNGDETTPNSSGELYTVYLQDNVPNNVADVSKAVNETEIQLLLTTVLSKLDINHPMSAKEYIFFDSCLQHSDDLSDGWEERLIEDFGDNHDDTLLKAEVSPPRPQSSTPVTPQTDTKVVVGSYLDAIQVNKHLISFAQEKNDKELLEVLLHLENKLSSRRLVNNYQEAIALNHHLIAFAKEENNKDLTNLLLNVDKKLHTGQDKK